MQFDGSMPDADVAAIIQSAENRGLRDPFKAFCVHRNGARSRKVQFTFTFAQWWEIWSPYFHLRGQGKNGLVMARHGDDGPYGPGNVYLTTNLGNWSDASKTRKRIEARQRTSERNARKSVEGRRYANVALKNEYRETMSFEELT